MNDFDDLISEVGEMGRYQIVIYLLICIAIIPTGFHYSAGLFLTPNVKHRCAVPGFTADTFASQGLKHDILVNFTLPQYYDEKRCVNVTSSCERYTNGYNSSKTTCNEWVFDKSTFTTTALEDYELVCDMAQWRTYSMVAAMVGTLCSSVITGTLADKYGRKKLFLVSNTIAALMGIVTAWSPNLPFFLICRVIVVGLMSSAYFSAFVLGLEMVGKSKRMWAGIIINIFWALGVEGLAGLAYAIRDWHSLQLSLSLPSLIFIVYIWVIPESPRWLITNGRHEDGMRVIETIAKYNKTHVPERFYDFDNFNVEGKVVAGSEAGKLWQLCGNGRLALRSFIILINWIAVMLGYFGLLLHAGSVSGNIYLNFFLGGLVEFPGYGLCLVFLNRVGRRVLHSTSMIISGVACICSIFTVVFTTVSECVATETFNVYTLVLSLFGRLFISSGFAVIFFYSSELFPTTLRNSGMGFCSLTSRVGAIAAPYIANLNVGGKLGETFPLLVIGLFSMLAGMLSLLLPETLNTKLPDTIEESKRFDRTLSRIAAQKVVNPDKKEAAYLI